MALHPHCCPPSTNPKTPEISQGSVGNPMSHPPYSLFKLCAPTCRGEINGNQKKSFSEPVLHSGNAPTLHWSQAKTGVHLRGSIFSSCFHVSPESSRQFYDYHLNLPNVFMPWFVFNILVFMVSLYCFIYELPQTIGRLGAEF